MHASPFDFVSVLSAEACCPVCSELHASVDQCECGACGSKICPDCASLRPDTSWICGPCAQRFPVLTVPPRLPTLWLRMFLARAAVLLARAEVGSARASAVLTSGLQTVRSHAREAHALSAIYLRRQHRLQRASLRLLLSSLAIALRNLHFRQHASSMLIATAILIAVARTQTSGDGR